LKTTPRYLSINYICKLEFYYVPQVYWDLAVFGVALALSKIPLCSFEVDKTAQMKMT
jgi:hypothetical protein